MTDHTTVYEVDNQQGPAVSTGADYSVITYMGKESESGCCTLKTNTTMETNYACLFSRVHLSVTPWTVARQAPLSVGFSRQGYWSGLPFPPPGDLPTLGIKPASPALQVDSLSAELLGKPYSN